MTQKEIITKTKYHLTPWRAFDYGLLQNIYIRTRYNYHGQPTVNDAIFFLDTETSKSRDRLDNYIVLWTLTIRVFGQNLVTLYGQKPSDCARCIERILNALRGEQTFIYIFNLSYDWVFLRKFLIKAFGEPVYQLNTKSHFPIYIEFDNGLILRDALILAQRTLEKWADDLNVEHKKAAGTFDYDVIRDQKTPFTLTELNYAEHDTLAGAECIDALKGTLNKQIFSMPWTATGIVREAVRKIAGKNQGHAYFLRNALTLPQLLIARRVYHGGYTHGNRAFYGETVNGLIECYDFASSYPFVMLSEKYPAEKFSELPNCSISDILEDTENAYMFKLIGYHVALKDYRFPMPALQYSKAVKCINPVVDNGRLLECDYIEIYLNEVDLSVINEQYDFEAHICIEVMAAYKNYLPRWLTDYVFKLFEDKTTLKGGDPVLYAIAKSQLNSIYGLHVQFPIKDNIKEDYKTGEYCIEPVDQEEAYKEFCEKRTTVIPYQTGVWVTSYAYRNLFELGKCVDYAGGGDWLYSDTDSAYSNKWNYDKIEAYNERCRKKLQANNYGPVNHNGRDYWLGVAELDGQYSQFRMIGAKRYAVRDKDSGKLKITVAGVPKKAGALCLNDDIENFTEGFIFSGKITGKKLHTHVFRDDIFIDGYGNEIGDSIDLTPTDYTLSSVRQWSAFSEVVIPLEVFDYE